MAEQQPSTETQLAILREQLEGLRGDVAEVRALVEGPPWERSVRGRLHTLEGEGAAAALASAALAEARLERRRATAARAEQRRGARTFRWKAIGAATALALALYPYLSHFAGWH